MKDISFVYQNVKGINEIQPFILDNYGAICLIQKCKLYQTYLLKNNIHNGDAKSLCEAFFKVL